MIRAEIKNYGWIMRKAIIFLAICLLIPITQLYPESFRTTVEGSFEVTPERAAENAISLGINSSVLINLGEESRFLRGVEIEITAPQGWLQYRGSLVMMMYNNLKPHTPSGVADIDGSRIAFEAVPSRLRIVYQIPVRNRHNLRTTTAASVIQNVVQPAAFPVLFRLMAVEKGLTAEFEQLTFSVVARPILSDEGAVKLNPRFPPQLRNRPFTVLIDDKVISNISEQVVLREGEHHLVVHSDEYRTESRRFIIERAKVLDLTIELQDPTPIVIFEGPQNAVIFLNNSPVRNREPVTLEPGQHEVKFQIGDYTVTRTLNIQRGKTYRVGIDIDLTIQEED